MSNPESAPQPVLSWFTLTSRPRSEAPLEIIKQWVDVTLPVRKEPVQHGLAHEIYSRKLKMIDQAVAVQTADAIEAFDQHDKSEAANWMREVLQKEMNVTEIWFSTADGEFLASTDKNPTSG